MLVSYKAGKFNKKGVSSYTSIDNKYKCIVEGRIYNALELVAKLKKAGVYLKSELDAEMVIELYRFSGFDAWNELSGDFAIILYDQTAKQLIAVRDGLGIKPLYYKLEADGIYFASKLSKLETHTRLSQEQLDYDGLAHYFTFQYIPEDLTYLKDVKHLSAGCVLTYDAENGAVIKPYQQLKVIKGIQTSCVTPKAVRETITASIHTRLQAGSCMGTFLSGGIDSTIVAKVAKQYDSILKAFSIGYDEPEYSELDDAKKSADEIGIELISRVVNAREYWQATKDSITHLDSPLADPSAPVLFLLAELASKHVDAVLSGEGADELFGGYPIYKEVDSLKLFTRVPERIKSNILSALRIVPNVKGKGYLTRGCTPLKNRYIGNAFIFTEEEKEQLLKFKGASWNTITDSIYEQLTDLSPLELMQTIDLHTWAKGDIFLKADRLTTAHGLEVRMPFLDESVLNLANELTKTEKISGKTSKMMLREAFKNELPNHMKNMKKRGFPVPLAKWLRGQLYEDIKVVILSPHTRVFINQDLALSMLEAHQKGKRDLSRPLWTIVIFILWVEQKMVFSD